MAKFNIEIKAENGIHENENIVEISICNGNWKYWDNYSETPEKTTLTINNIYDAYYLNRPVNDAIAHYDQEELEKGNIIMDEAYIRTYETLLGYLNCRIANLKQMKYQKTMTSHILLFEREYMTNKEREVTTDMVYKTDCLIQIKIEKVE